MFYVQSWWIICTKRKVLRGDRPFQECGLSVVMFQTKGGTKMFWKMSECTGFTSSFAELHAIQGHKGGPVVDIYQEINTCKSHTKGWITKFGKHPQCRAAVLASCSFTGFFVSLSEILLCQRARFLRQSSRALQGKPRGAVRATSRVPLAETVRAW